MFNLYEIVQNAQDGQAVDNLAKQFNISPGEADAAVKALLPALSTAFLQRAAEPAAFGSILGALGDPQHAAAFADPDAALSSETTQKGAAALQHLFGSPDTSAQIAQHAAGVAGLPPALIQQMAPVIASLILGGLTKGLANQGLGGVFGQLASAAGQGGLGSILGGLLGGAPAAQSQPQGAPQANPQINPDAPGGLGGLGGVLQSILGGLLAGKSVSPTPQEGAAPQGPGGIDPGTVQSGLDALIKMLQPGTPPPPTGQQAGLQNEINAILTGKRS
ncbi:DUF937 domain-containing protein [Methylocella sp.]|jgi:hypothetical protein|uniref:DUF937 domain-containing protein n=1 Tax=Methylocella sp. TaxID=1978226 RepID=UPI003C172E28